MLDCVGGYLISEPGELRTVVRCISSLRMHLLSTMSPHLILYFGPASSFKNGVADGFLR